MATRKHRRIRTSSEFHTWQPAAELRIERSIAQWRRRWPNESPPLFAWGVRDSGRQFLVDGGCLAEGLLHVGDAYINVSVRESGGKGEHLDYLTLKYFFDGDFPNRDRYIDVVTIRTPSDFEEIESWCAFGTQLEFDLDCDLDVVNVSGIKSVIPLQCLTGRVLRDLVVLLRHIAPFVLDAATKLGGGGDSEWESSLGD